MRAGEVDMASEVSHAAQRRSRRTKWPTIKPSPAAPTSPRASPSRNSPPLPRRTAFADLAGGCMPAGHVGEEQVLRVRVGKEAFATAAQSSHYHGPLAD